MAPTTTAIAKTQTTALDNVRGLLEKTKPRLAQFLPKHLSVDRFVRIALFACHREPKLLQCKPMTIVDSVVRAAQLGLEPGGVLGDGYLVPYKDECQFIPGYRGLISLARRSGQIVSIEAHVVYEKDHFTCKYGLDPVLEHEPDWSDNPGAMRAVYAVAHLRDEGVQYEVMTRAQVEKIRTRSPASKSSYSPWSNADDYFEMARKTVVRRLCKYLPMSVEMRDALDNVEDSGDDSMGPSIDLSAVETPKSKTQQVKETLAAARAQGEPQDATTEDEPEPTPEGVPLVDDTTGETTFMQREPGQEG
jgi:recombination protein RecT